MTDDADYDPAANARASYELAVAHARIKVLEDAINGLLHALFDGWDLNRALGAALDALGPRP